MRRICLVLVMCCLGCIPAASDSAHTSLTDTLWLRAADSADDGIRASDTEDSLRLRFGAANVIQAWLYEAEGDSVKGTTIFPDDSTRRIEVRWSDVEGRRHPARAEIAEGQSRWVVYPNVSAGTRLAAIERLNGRPFDMSGFEWDYAGAVINWRDGHLDSLWGTRASGQKSVWVQFAVDEPADPALTSKVIGDHEYSSASPPMRTLNPRIRQISVTPR
ncbi:MAG: hypothetical protein ABIT20_10070 [Gemmatimonadaceae bacterium]